jgi:hypothetical protein
VYLSLVANHRQGHLENIRGSIPIPRHLPLADSDGIRNDPDLKGGFLEFVAQEFLVDPASPHTTSQPRFLAAVESIEGICSAPGVGEG